MILDLKKRRFKRGGRRVLPRLRAWAWRYRWIWLMVTIVTFPLHTIYLLALARAGLGWLPLVCFSVMLLVLMIVGSRRQTGTHRSGPPKVGMPYEPVQKEADYPTAA